MQVAAAGTGVRLSDGSTNVLPVGPTERVHDAWRLHHGLVRRSLARAYYQGWDMHPGHLPTRYAAVYAFYREGLETAAARLAAASAGTPGPAASEAPAPVVEEEPVREVAVSDLVGHQDAARRLREWLDLVFRRPELLTRLGAAARLGVLERASSASRRVRSSGGSSVATSRRRS